MNIAEIAATRLLWVRRWNPYGSSAPTKGLRDRDGMFDISGGGSALVQRGDLVSQKEPQSVRHWLQLRDEKDPIGSGICGAYEVDS
eukprot:scaffold1220_cov259-Pinguiococcus_pyrenoidosus.AAC.148